MNYLRKILKVLLPIILFLLNSCAKNENLIPQNLIGNWTVVSFDDNLNMTKVFKTSTNTWPNFNNGDNTVNFSKSSSSSGEISGSNVSNTFTGRYEIYFGNRIVIKEGIWTLINEPEWGALFRSIGLAESYELTGNNLIIF